jgi:hypothetical protein
MDSDLTTEDLQNFENLGKKSVIFFQSRGAKKSKIGDMIGAYKRF